MAEAHLHGGHFEESLAELFKDPLEMAEMRTLVDDETFDLVEHRRMRLVAVATIGAPGQMTRMGGFCASIVRTCTGDVCVRNNLRSPLASG